MRTSFLNCVYFLTVVVLPTLPAAADEPTPTIRPFLLADDLDEQCDLVTNPQNASRVQALQEEHVRIVSSKRSTTVKKRGAATRISFRKPSGAQPAPINAEDLFKPVRRYENQ